jgi:hypothetical protein
MLTRRFLRGPCLLCLALLVMVGVVLLTGGCPRPSTNTDNSGGQTDNGSATDGNGTSGDTSNGGTSGGDTNNGSTGGDTSGNGTSGGDTNGGSTGGSTDGNGTSGDTNNGGTGGDSGGTTPAPTAVSLAAIARTGDTVPGQPSGVTFTTFGAPVIDAKGRVAFWGFYAGTGAKGTAGLYVDDGTSLEKVVDNDPASVGAVPGRSSASYFDYDPNQPDIAWGGGDRLLFCALIQPASQDSGASVSGVYRWLATDASIVRVADRDQIAATFPDVANVTLFSLELVTPGVSDGGLAAFGARYQYIRDPNSPLGSNPFVGFGSNGPAHGVFTSNGTTITRIADDSSQRAGTVADYPADGYFSAVVEDTTISAAGDTLFQGTYVSGSSTWRGVYVARGGVPYRVIDNRTGASWAGLPSGAQFLARSATLGYALGIGPAGRIVVAGRLAVGGTTDNAVLLWDWDAQTWAELTGAGGAAATALLSGVNDTGQAVVLSGGDPYLASGTAQTKLDATPPTGLPSTALVWLESGGAVNNNGRAAVQYTNSDKPGLALWTGEKLLVVADGQAGTPANLTEIHTIVGPEQDRPGRSGLLDDNDDLTFRAVFSDSTEAVYIGLSQ